MRGRLTATREGSTRGRAHGVGTYGVGVEALGQVCWVWGLSGAGPEPRRVLSREGL